MRRKLTLRALLLFVTMIAISLAYFSNRGRIRSQLISTIEELGGTKVVRYPEIPPAWTSALIPRECFCSIESIFLPYRTATDDDMRRVAVLPETKHIATNIGRLSLVFYLSLEGERSYTETPQITDNGIKHLDILNLESLTLLNTKVTNDGIRLLTKHPDLEFLAIESKFITDESIVHLAKMKSLRKLWINGTAITRQGFEQLKQLLPNCEIKYVAQL